MSSDINTKASNNIRVIGVEQVANGDSGHQGLPCGMAPTAHILFSEFLNITKKNPKWAGRDRFVLSAGHGSALLYTMLHLMGYLGIEDLKAFRSLHSKTPGHPESRLTDGVEFTTGPLGQGLSASVGMAIAQSHMSKRFDKEGFPLFDHFTYVICGDGCMQEGITSEASSLAGHLGLGKLIVFYDDNKTTIDGNTNITFTENVYKRYEAYNWDVQVVENGDSDFEAIRNAIIKARKDPSKPHLIGVKTTIGFGSGKTGNACHGYFLKLNDALNMRKNFGLKQENFHIEEDVYDFYKKAQNRGNEMEQKWTKSIEEYTKKYPELGLLLKNFIDGQTPSIEEIIKKLPKTDSSKDKPSSTRKLSGNALNSLNEIYPFLLGGSADLEGSNCTKLNTEKIFQKDCREGKTIRFGIREHAMASISNGICEYGGQFVPFCATFFVFAGYLLGAMRISSLAELRVIYILTHDSVFVGQDGPTHQPVESLGQIRQFPNMNVFRPCDANEMSSCYAIALNSKRTPSVMVLSRQDFKAIQGTDSTKALKGGYVVKDCKDPKAVVVATGSEVILANDVALLLKDQIRVVSMPSTNIFDKQDLSYKMEVLFDCKVPVISLEAGTTLGWEKYSHYQIGLNHFGMSAHESLIEKEIGFSANKIAEKVTNVIEFYQKEPSLVSNFLKKPVF